MEDITKRLHALQQVLNDGWTRIGGDDKSRQLADLQAAMARPDFWNDPGKAGKDAQTEGALRSSLEPWQKLRSEVADSLELVSLGDSGMALELSESIEDLERRADELKKDLRYTGTYDDLDATLSISAGAGGTDAQDWAAMLLRMYVRWAEKAGFKATVIDQSDGEEAGIKSATLEISGLRAYGRLRSEHGVHRLVRLSPFNADNLRQTSFALVETVPVIDSPDSVLIDDKDLKIDVYRSGGKGGQSVNTTDSAVRITHIPSGIVVAIQNERSQLQNKETAMTILRGKLAALAVEQHQADMSAIKGPAPDAAWGNQIRNYVLHPYTMVKDGRTKCEDRDAASVLDGKLDAFMDAYLDAQKAE